MNYSLLNNRYNILMDLGNKVFPRQMNYAIAVNIMNMEEKLRPYHDQRYAIITSYAVKDENGAYVIVNNEYSFKSPEDREKCTIEVDALGQIAIDIDFVTFNVAELKKCEADPRYDLLTPIQEASLSWMIEY